MTARFTAKVNFVVNVPELEKFSDQVQTELLDTIGFILVGDIKKELYSAKHSGRWYHKTKRAQTARRRLKTSTKFAHRASAPGEPPAIDTGRMAISIMHRMYGSAGRRRVSVGAADDALKSPSVGEAYAAKHGFRSGKVRAPASTAGTQLLYPYWLEVGQSFAPRPWLRPVIDRYTARPGEIVRRARAHLQRLGKIK